MDGVMVNADSVVLSPADVRRIKRTGYLWLTGAFCFGGAAGWALCAGGFF